MDFSLRTPTHNTTLPPEINHTSIDGKNFSIIIFVEKERKTFENLNFRGCPFGTCALFFLWKLFFYYFPLKIKTNVKKGAH
jgi:hypothetical protein